jgi:hypothetical protein
MKSQEGYTLSSVTLTKKGIYKDSGVFERPSTIECVEDGAIEITWEDGTNTAYTHFKAGMRNTIRCRAIEILAGRFNIGWD